MAYNLIPYCGSLIATSSMIPPVYAKVAGPGVPPLGCCEAIFCAGCVVCQLKNEIGLRRAKGQPILPAPMVMMMMPGMVAQHPGMVA